MAWTSQRPISFRHKSGAHVRSRRVTNTSSPRRLNPSPARERQTFSEISTAACRWRREQFLTTNTTCANNAFECNPPSILGAFNENNDTSLYSIGSRYYYVACNKRFWAGSLSNDGSATKQPNAPQGAAPKPPGFKRVGDLEIAPPW